MIALFLAHEPAAIRFGRRGVRAAREYGAAAARWLRACVTCALGAGIGAALIIEPSLRWSLAVPALPTLVLAAAMVRGQEKSWYGEIAAALAFAGAAVPVALAAGAPPD
ncbi:MAG: YwiC-like family protein, partial [Vicinamibacterales bacterium]